MAKFPERVFSGVQPTGNLHLGNYLGAIKRFVMQTTHPCIYCVVDLHAMTLPHEPESSPYDPRGDSGFPRLRHRSESQHRLQPKPRRRARRARLGVRLRGPARLAQPHDPVQGEGRQGPGERIDRALQLSRADGCRHPRISRYSCSGRRGPEAASGARARYRAEVQQRFRGVDRRERAWRCFFSSARAADSGPGDAGDELARRHEENVEVGPFGKRSHRADRRCRHDRAEDPQGQDGPRAVAERARGPGARPEADNLVGIFAALTDETKAEVLHRFGGAQFSTFKNALAEVTVEKLAPIRAEMLRLAPIPPNRCRPGCGGEKARAIARPNMDAIKDILGLVR